jgi:hypothetical protein
MSQDKPTTHGAAQLRPLSCAPDIGAPPTDWSLVCCCPIVGAIVCCAEGAFIGVAGCISWAYAKPAMLHSNAAPLTAISLAFMLTPLFESKFLADPPEGRVTAPPQSHVARSEFIKRRTDRNVSNRSSFESTKPCGASDTKVVYRAQLCRGSVAPQVSS